MKDSIRRWMPLFAAALLASLTIRVFFELQDYGPESAIRRFLGAVRRPDEMQAMYGKTWLPTEPELEMIRVLAYWQSHGVSAQVGRLERVDDEIRAAVIFSFPNGTNWGFAWVVQRKGIDWRVDVNKTATIFRDSRPPNYQVMH